ncbi:acyl-CoA thioesterase [Croceicoccus mobilis]|uniref:HotDog ACOT-type domain-containing protein n=1 Tax=Croceicoccus mobilis TaxID=1703339 RepID=A0A916Z242_9SPHN|nr:acyl-CoA thioesterase [Croceicoccus mobilis]GGD72562.1 hypothetical protein GCM10010990_22690 [Croceicoccus mobilis]
MSGPVTATLVLPENANLHGGAFGGWIMGQGDIAAGIAGRRHAGPCVTKAVNELVFLAALRVGDVFMIEAEVEEERRTSFTLALSGVREDESGTREQVLTARFTMVCIDKDGRPRPLRGS